MEVTPTATPFVARYVTPCDNCELWFEMLVIEDKMQTACNKSLKKEHKRMLRKTSRSAKKLLKQLQEDITCNLCKQLRCLVRMNSVIKDPAVDPKAKAAIIEQKTNYWDQYAESLYYQQRIRRLARLRNPKDPSHLLRTIGIEKTKNEDSLYSMVALCDMFEKL